MRTDLDIAYSPIEVSSDSLSGDGWPLEDLLGHVDPSTESNSSAASTSSSSADCSDTSSDDSSSSEDEQSRWQLNSLLSAAGHHGAGIKYAPMRVRQPAQAMMLKEYARHNRQFTPTELEEMQQTLAVYCGSTRKRKPWFINTSKGARMWQNIKQVRRPLGLARVNHQPMLV